MTAIDLLIQQSPPLVIAVPLFAAFLLPLVSRVTEKGRNIFALAMLGLTGFFIALLASDILAHGPRIYIFGRRTSRFLWCGFFLKLTV